MFYINFEIPIKYIIYYIRDFQKSVNYTKFLLITEYYQHDFPHYRFVVLPKA